MFYDITRVVPLPDYRLRLTFDDGAEGEVDLRAQVPFTGVFEPLREPSEFRKVRVNPESGTIEWPNDVDLDPIVLYAAVTGKTIPEVLAATAMR
jgi:hypothetical protein